MTSLTYKTILEAQTSLSKEVAGQRKEVRGEICSPVSPRGLLLQMYRSLRCSESEVDLCCPRSLLGGGTALSPAVCLVKSQHHGGLSPLSQKKKSSPSTQKEWCNFRKKKTFPMETCRHTLLPSQTHTEQCVSGLALLELSEQKEEGGGGERAGFEKMREEIEVETSKHRSSSACCSEVAAQRTRAGAICL